MLECTTMAARTETGEVTGTKPSCAVPADCVAGPLDSGNDSGRDAVEFDVRVVGLIEDNLWYARALELNLLGYGESFANALDDLNPHGRVQPPRMHETVEAIVHWALVRSYVLSLRRGCACLHWNQRSVRAIERGCPDWRDDPTLG